MEYSNTAVYIDLDAILENYREICAHAGAPVMAVVKADAYGHGAVPVAKLLERNGCAFFGVSSMSEALELRHAGIEKPILVLGHTPVHTFSAAVEQQIRIGIFSYTEALALSEEAVRQNKKAYIHLVLDTGMSRIGFQTTQEAADICTRIAALPGIVTEGLYSHFATADEADLTKTKRQSELFRDFDEMLRRRGVEVPLRHMDNSAGIINFGCNWEMVRAGIVLYGMYPSDEVALKQLILKPAMSWHTRVSHVKQLEPGREISYGGTFITDRTMTVATVPAGYADGYRRSLSNKFYVLIRGKKAPILGRVCMDQMMVDVTEIPGVVPGDDVVLMGKSDDAVITAEELSAAAGSFNYEQVCTIGRRVARVYLLGGKKVENTDYLLGE